MRRYRIIYLNGDFGTKYYPQVRRWLLWRNILPENQPACGSVREARGIVYNCVTATDAFVRGGVIEHFSADRTTWRDMAPPLPPADMPQVVVPQAEVMQPVNSPAPDSLFAGPFPAGLNYVQPTEPWPRDTQWPPASHPLLEGVKQPDPYVLVPWLWRWLVRFIGTRQDERKRRLALLERRIDRLVRDAVASQVGVRHRPSRSRSPANQRPPWVNPPAA